VTLDVRDANQIEVHLKTSPDGVTGELIPHHIIDTLPPLPAGGNNLGLVDAPIAIVAGASHVAAVCTVANTDYAVGAVPAGVVRALVVSVTYDALIANEVTTGTVGTFLRANQPYSFRVTPGDVLHVQSATALAVVEISYLKA